MKSAGSSAQAAPTDVPYSHWDDDTDDDRLQEVVEDEDHDHDDADEDEEIPEDDNFDEVLFGKDPKGIMPTINEIQIFERRTKLAEEFGEEEWREVKAKQVAKFWCGLPGAKKFAGPKPDNDCPELKYKNQKQT